MEREDAEYLHLEDIGSESIDSLKSVIASLTVRLAEAELLVSHKDDVIASKNQAIAQLEAEIRQLKDPKIHREVAESSGVTDSGSISEGEHRQVFAEEQQVTAVEEVDPLPLLPLDNETCKLIVEDNHIPNATTLSDGNVQFRTVSLSRYCVEFLNGLGTEQCTRIHVSISVCKRLKEIESESDRESVSVALSPEYYWCYGATECAETTVQSWKRHLEHLDTSTRESRILALVINGGCIHTDDEGNICGMSVGWTANTTPDVAVTHMHLGHGIQSQMEPLQASEYVWYPVRHSMLHALGWRQYTLVDATTAAKCVGIAPNALPPIASAFLVQLSDNPPRTQTTSVALDGCDTSGGSISIPSPHVSVVLYPISNPTHGLSRDTGRRKRNAAFRESVKTGSIRGRARGMTNMIPQNDFQAQPALIRKRTGMLTQLVSCLTLSRRAQRVVVKHSNVKLSECELQLQGNVMTIVDIAGKATYSFAVPPKATIPCYTDTAAGRVVDLTDTMAAALSRKAPTSMRLAFARQRHELEWRRALVVASGLDDLKPSMLLPRDELGDSDAWTKIGAGAFGAVFKATLRGTPVAIKRVDMPLEFGDAGSRDPADVIQFFMEVLVLLKLRHAHILHLTGVSFPSETDPSKLCEFYLVTEYLSGGNLGNLLRKKIPSNSMTTKEEELVEYRERLPSNVLLRLWREFFSGLTYLHLNGVIHRDIKPENIVMTRDVKYMSDEGITDPFVKIVDFGQATLSQLDGRSADPEKQTNAESDAAAEMTLARGTVRYRAPELIDKSDNVPIGKGKAVKDMAVYSTKADVYSAIVVMWECWTRRRPFQEMTGPMIMIEDAVASGMRPAIPTDCPPFFHALLQRGWCSEPALRPSASAVLDLLQNEENDLHENGRLVLLHPLEGLLTKRLDTPEANVTVAALHAWKFLPSSCRREVLTALETYGEDAQQARYSASVQHSLVRSVRELVEHKETLWVSRTECQEEELHDDQVNAIKLPLLGLKTAISNMDLEQKKSLNTTECVDLATYNHNVFTLLLRLVHAMCCIDAPTIEATHMPLSLLASLAEAAVASPPEKCIVTADLEHAARVSFVAVCQRYGIWMKAKYTTDPATAAAPQRDDTDPTAQEKGHWDMTTTAWAQLYATVLHHASTGVGAAEISRPLFDAVVGVVTSGTFLPDLFDMVHSRIPSNVATLAAGSTPSTEEVQCLVEQRAPDAVWWTTYIIERVSGNEDFGSETALRCIALLLHWLRKFPVDTHCRTEPSLQPHDASGIFPGTTDGRLPIEAAASRREFNFSFLVLVLRVLRAYVISGNANAQQRRVTDLHRLDTGHHLLLWLDAFKEHLSPGLSLKACSTISVILCFKSELLAKGQLKSADAARVVSITQYFYKKLVLAHKRLGKDLGDNRVTVAAEPSVQSSATSESARAGTDSNRPHMASGGIPRPAAPTGNALQLWHNACVTVLRMPMVLSRAHACGPLFINHVAVVCRLVLTPGGVLQPTREVVAEGRQFVHNMFLHRDAHGRLAAQSVLRAVVSQALACVRSNEWDGVVALTHAIAVACASDTHAAEFHAELLGCEEFPVLLSMLFSVAATARLPEKLVEGGRWNLLLLLPLCVSIPSLGFIRCVEFLPRVFAALATVKQHCAENGLPSPSSRAIGTAHSVTREGSQKEPISFCTGTASIPARLEEGLAAVYCVVRTVVRDATASLTTSASDVANASQARASAVLRVFCKESAEAAAREASVDVVEDFYCTPTVPASCYSDVIDTILWLWTHDDTVTNHSADVMLATADAAVQILREQNWMKLGQGIPDGIADQAGLNVVHVIHKVVEWGHTDAVVDRLVDKGGGSSWLKLLEKWCHTWKNAGTAGQFYTTALAIVRDVALQRCVLLHDAPPARLAAWPWDKDRTVLDLANRIVKSGGSYGLGKVDPVRLEDARRAIALLQSYTPASDASGRSMRKSSKSSLADGEDAASTRDTPDFLLRLDTINEYLTTISSARGRCSFSDTMGALRSKFGAEACQKLVCCITLVLQKHGLVHCGTRVGSDARGFWTRVQYSRKKLAFGWTTKRPLWISLEGNEVRFFAEDDVAMGEDTELKRSIKLDRNVGVVCCPDDCSITLDKVKLFFSDHMVSTIWHQRILHAQRTASP
eukprot:m.885112 g.885112  ORF g.885112 m.885112 type:complete len:2139 (-) comp23616_c0_seq3:40-6456(-)